MSSIFQGQINKNISQEDLDNYNSVGIPSKIPGLKEVDISKLSSDTLRTLNGGIIKFSPATIANQTLRMINYMRSNPQYSFLVPYIEKPVIWTFQIDSAMTDGVRIYMNPLFAHMLLAIKTSEANEYYKELEKEYKAHKEEYIQIYNNKLTKLLRFVIVHECFHILYNHARRGILKYGSHPSKEEHTRANIAMDLEINRDIEASFEDLRGSTDEIGKSVWYLYEEYYKSDGTIFRKDIWEPIWDDWTNNKKSFDRNDQFKSENYNPKQRDKAQQGAFADGWRKAVQAIKDKRIDPKTFNI